MNKRKSNGFLLFINILQDMAHQIGSADENHICAAD